MNDIFEQRVRAAAVAGWWTFLIAAGFLMLQWVLYLLFMSARPGWLLSLWGPGANWPTVQNLSFWPWLSSRSRNCRRLWLSG